MNAKVRVINTRTTPLAHAHATRPEAGDTASPLAALTCKPGPGSAD